MLAAGYAFLLACLIAKMNFFKLEGIPKSWPVGVFIIKILAGVLLAYIYTYVYPNRSEADVFRFFDHSKIIFNTLYTQPLDFLRFMTGIDAQNPCMEKYYRQMLYWSPTQNNLVTKVNAIIYFFSMGSFYVHIVFFCFLSLVGQIAIVKVFLPYAQNILKKRLLILGICLLPSVLLWSSGPLKDSISVFGFGLLCYHFTLLINDHFSFSRRRIAWLGALVTLLYFNKAYVLMTALPAFTLYAFMQSPNNKWFQTHNSKALSDKLFAKILSMHILFLFVFVFTSFLPATYNIPFRIVNKQHEFIKIGEETLAGSYVPTAPLNNDSWSVLKATPKAIYQTLSRPMFTQAHTSLAKMAAAENLLIAMILLIALLFAKSSKSNIAVLTFSFGITIWLFALIGLTTPIIGAMVRYKIIVLPFLVGACILLFDEEVFEQRLKQISWKTNQ